MMHKIVFPVALLGLMCLVAMGQAAPTGRSSDSLAVHARGSPFLAELSGLPAPAQASISAALGREISDYHARSASHGFHTESARRAIAADFTAQGIEVTRGSAHWAM